MISAFVGTPGSGKSYEAVKKILENLKLGRKVFTNIEGLEKEKCQEAIKIFCNLTDYQLQLLLHHLTDDEALCFWDHCIPGSLIVIDEVHKLFSNRDWQTEKNRKFTEWSSTHRHDGFDVLLITQDIEKVDKHARSLIEWTYFYRKVNFFGSLVSKKYICYAYAGDNHNGKPLGKSSRTYNSKVFACYSSFSSDGVIEKSFMKHVNILRHPIFYSIPVLLIVFMVIFSKSGLSKGRLLNVSKQDVVEGKVENNEDQFSSVIPPPANDETSTPVVENVDLKSVVKAYRLTDGSIKWTNNGYIPQNSIFIKKL